MAYLYGRRPTADLGPLGAALRGELYEVPYAALDFERHRHDVTPGDLHVGPSRALRLAAAVLAELDRAMPAPLRRRALAHCLTRIRFEQRESRERGLSPVNAVLNCLALWANDPDDPALAAGLAGLEAWRWEDAGGVRYAGARSNAWDTAFAMRALFTPEDARHAAAIRRGAAFLRQTQLTEELPRWWGEHREPITGGWCFSDGAHRWPVSDCAGEAVSALLALHDDARPEGERIAPERLRQAAQFILSRQNTDGGFSTYERQRGPAWLGRLSATHGVASSAFRRGPRRARPAHR